MLAEIMSIFSIPVLIVLFIIIDLLFFVSDKYITSFYIMILGYGLFSHYGFGVDWHNVFSLTMSYSLYYLALGVAVAFVKWSTICMDIASEIRELSKKFSIQNPFEGMNPFSGFLRYVDNASSVSYKMVAKFLSIPSIVYYDNKVTSREEMLEYLTPAASKHKSEVTFWILQWPIVLISLVFENLLVKLGQYLAEIFEVLTKGLAKRIISGATTGIVDLTPPKTDAPVAAETPHQ